MLKGINILLTQNQKKQCVFFLFGTIIASFLEIIGIGSIPVFAMIIVDLNFLKSKLPSFIDLNLLDQFSQNQVVLLAAVALAVIFLLKNLYLTLMIYYQGTIVKTIRNNLGLRLFKSYINAQYIFHLQRNPANLLRGVIADVDNATDVIMSSIVLFRELLVLIFIFTLLFYADPLISLSIFLFCFFSNRNCLSYSFFCLYRATFFFFLFIGISNITSC